MADKGKERAPILPSEKKKARIKSLKEKLKKHEHKTRRAKLSGRVIDDLDMGEFVVNFLSPYRPEDSAGYMAKELVDLKDKKGIKTYRKTIEKLINNPSSKKKTKRFVENTYELKDHWKERLKVAPGIGGYKKLSEFGRRLEKLSKKISYLSKESIRKLIRTDLNVLGSYKNTVEAGKELKGEGCLADLKELALTLSRTDNYHNLESIVEDLENYGEGKIHISYDYFDNVKGTKHVKFDPEEKGVKELLGWYFDKTKDKFSFSLFPPRKKKFLAKGLEFLIDKTSPQIQKILDERKKADFFLGATRYVRKMKEKGLPLTYPSFEKEEGFKFKDLYNPNLLLQDHIRNKEDIVPNEAALSPDRNITIITGANNTGKTVYVKSIGLGYALAQNGLPVPAEDAELSELEKLYTHFISPADITREEGMYVDEIRRLKDLFQNATRESLLIVDEPIRGSSPKVAKKMSLRFIKGFKNLKAPTLLTTHFHSVSEEVDEWDKIRNLHTEVKGKGGEFIPTYNIKAGRAGKSYGIEIADELGLTEDYFEKIGKGKDKKS